MSDDRRYRILYITEDALLDVLNGDLTVVSCDVPGDARVVRAFVDHARNAFGIVIRSAQFDPVALGMALPQLPPIAVRGSRTPGFYGSFAAPPPCPHTSVSIGTPDDGSSDTNY